MDGSGLVRQLRELSELHAAGAISDGEFAAAKEAVLNGHRPDGASPAADPGADPTPPLSAPGGPARAAGRFAWHGGAITAGAGGLLTLLAFVSMPLATVPFFGSITGANAAGFSSQFGVLGLLWLVPLLAAGVVGIAGWQIFGARHGQRRAGSIITMVFAGLVVLDYVVVLGAVQAETSKLGASVAGFFGAGFWIAVLGIVAAGIGAAVETAASRVRSGPPDGAIGEFA